jgi:Leucine-rich repeat (LRR) protein
MDILPKELISLAISHLNYYDLNLDDTLGVNWTQVYSMRYTSYKKIDSLHEYIESMVEEDTSLIRDVLVEKIENGIVIGTIGGYLRDMNVTDMQRLMDTITLMSNTSYLSNKITGFPKGFEYLSRLTHINLYRNNIREIPGEIRFLVHLDILDVSENQISNLPEGLFELQSLQSLKLNNNIIREIPPGIGNMQHLAALNLDHNPIMDIPKEIGKLLNLEILTLGVTFIRSIPVELVKLPKLSDLLLNQTSIRELPKEIWKSNIGYLNISNTLIEDIPKVTGMTVIYYMDQQRDT